MLHKIKRRVKRMLGYKPAPPVAPTPRVPLANNPDFHIRKQRKLARIRDLLTPGKPFDETKFFFDFLTEQVRADFNIADTDNISAHEYDGNAEKIILDNPNGMILDCGAGLRPRYLDNVVNFEICPYETTDVRGVGEQLPFRDGVFDAVFSFNVLEHVKNPFSCAAEICRVMKPGGTLYCVVPFLQPFHAYPHHYYNMSHQGLRNLFEGPLQIEKQEVNGGGLPIFTLSWFLTRWVVNLPEKTRERFLKMRVEELIADPLVARFQPFVTELPAEQNFELASTTSLFARKPLT